jgi:hypothetical protein
MVLVGQVQTASTIKKKFEYVEAVDVNFIS